MRIGLWGEGEADADDGQTTFGKFSIAESNENISNDP